MLQVYVSSVSVVSDICFKCSIWMLQSRSWCCICCSCCTCMLQASVPNVSSVFSYVCCKCVYQDIAYVSHICCKYFYLDVASVCNNSQVFSGIFVSVSDVYCKCFNYFWRMLHMFHLDVAKSISGMLHILRVGEESRRRRSSPTATSGPPRAGSEAGEGGPHRAAQQASSRGRLDVRALAVPIVKS
jgi:hypothetical protein